MAGERIEASEAALESVVYNAEGLVPAIVQDASTRAVLMMAWMSAETLALTLAEGRTVFWSRSRREIWRKGETSGERQWVRDAYYDCDGDALLFIVDQDGSGACHTGAYSCFDRSFGESTVLDTQRTLDSTCRAGRAEESAASAPTANASGARAARTLA